MLCCLLQCEIHGYERGICHQRPQCSEQPGESSGATWDALDGSVFSLHPAAKHSPVVSSDGGNHWLPGLVAAIASVGPMTPSHPIPSPHGGAKALLHHRHGLTC